MNRLVIDGLAVWRLARLLVVEDAPPAVAARRWLNRRLPPAWAPAVDCVHCSALWIALAAGPVRDTTAWRWASWPLAVAGAASLASVAVAAIEPDEHVEDASGVEFHEPPGR